MIGLIWGVNPPYPPKVIMPSSTVFRYPSALDLAYMGGKPPIPPKSVYVVFDGFLDPLRWVLAPVAVGARAPPAPLRPDGRPHFIMFCPRAVSCSDRKFKGGVAYAPPPPGSFTLCCYQVVYIPSPIFKLLEPFPVLVVYSERHQPLAPFACFSIGLSLSFLFFFHSVLLI